MDDLYLGEEFSCTLSTVSARLFCNCKHLTLYFEMAVNVVSSFCIITFSSRFPVGLSNYGGSFCR